MTTPRLGFPRMFHAAACLMFSPAAWALTVSADFEGGSCKVLKVDESARTVEVMPAGDPGRGWPCWWYFQMDDCTPGKSVTVVLHGSDAPMPRDEKHKPLAAGWAMPDRAFFSADGEHWEKTAAGVKDKDAIRYELAAPGSKIQVAWAPPFTPSRAGKLVKDTAEKHGRYAKAEQLCLSVAGRPVPMLHIMEGGMPADKRPAVWLEARQHAWEAGSSWVAQGCVEWLVSEDPDAAWLRSNAETFVVPIMDVDNTATGNGGKDELPQDHNRDWSESPHWNEVAAVQERVRGFVKQGRMAVFLDLHNPAPNDKKAYFYVLPANLLPASVVAARDQFVSLATAEIAKVYPMSEKPREDGPGYHPLWRQISGTWVSMNGNADTVGICLETAWNVPEAGTENWRKTGAALAASTARHLRQKAAR